MLIKKIDIKQGEKKSLNLTFNNRLTVLKNNDLIKDIIALITDAPFEKEYRNNVSFFAEVLIANRTFHICGKKPQGERGWSLSVCKKGENEECVAEYLSMLRQCSEEKCFNNFSNFKRQNYPHRISCYKDIERHYPRDIFSKITDGYGCTRSFRVFMNEYIKNFSPVKLCKNKNYYLKLLPDGRFVVGDDTTNDINLSEGETVLYNYHCFLCLADFWSKAEKIRNLNRVNKPLIVSHFLELLDDSFDLSEIMHLTNKIDRQVIIFSEKHATFK